MSLFQLSMYKLIVGALCFLTTIIDETEPVILSNDRKSIEGFSFRVSAFEVLFFKDFNLLYFEKKLSYILNLVSTHHVFAKEWKR